MHQEENAALDTAETESAKTLSLLLATLRKRDCFKLEAGAGAGKTYSLIQALNHIVLEKGKFLPYTHQRVACLTYTNVARDEIVLRTDGNPLIFTDTLHGFLWEMIQPYQNDLARALHESPDWKERLAEHPIAPMSDITYDLGFRSIHPDRVTLHHDDIPKFAVKLFENEKFRILIADRFPIIFVDEYQDTPEGIAEAFLSCHHPRRKTPVVGFFGDDWQQIYDKTCGSITRGDVLPIAKGANFRSDRSIVDFLNRLRPELQQAPRAEALDGEVAIYHTNKWPGERLRGQWKDQLPHDAVASCRKWLESESPSSDWILKSKDRKTLMLTHKVIANEAGYPNLPSVYKYNDAFTGKEDPVIEFFVDTLEPAVEAFDSMKYGRMFRILGGTKPLISSTQDKIEWSSIFDSISQAMNDQSVGTVLDILVSQELFEIPPAVSRKDRECRELLSIDDPAAPRSLREHAKLRQVQYSEIQALRRYLERDTPFSTKHSVKGAEFDDVVVLVGRGWNKYDFDGMLASHATRDSPGLAKKNSFLASRNLFYVAASRAKHNLAILFVQKLSAQSLKVLSEWVGEENIHAIEFD